MKAIAIIMGIMASLAGFAREYSAMDSVAAEVNRYKFSGKQIIAPAALITTGAVGTFTLKHAQERLASHLGHDKAWKGDNYLQFVPYAVYMPLGLIPGVDYRTSFADRILTSATSYLTLAIITNATKHLVHRTRPDGSDSNSFPSGHAATAFAGAELMRIEYGPWVGAAGYLAATAVAYLRLYNNRHWLCDVIAGAGIGILSARIAYWLLPWERKIFKFLPHSGNILVAPFTPPGGAGFTTAINF